LRPLDFFEDELERLREDELERRDRPDELLRDDLLRDLLRDDLDLLAMS
jgi:hypothetical protein